MLHLNYQQILLPLPVIYIPPRDTLPPLSICTCSSLSLEHFLQIPVWFTPSVLEVFVKNHLMREAFFNDHTENSNPSSTTSVPLTSACPVYFTAVVPVWHKHIHVYYICVCVCVSLMSFFLSEHNLHMSRDYFVQYFFLFPEPKTIPPI